MLELIPDDWRIALSATLASSEVAALERSIVDERSEYGPAILPDPTNVFAALAATPLDQVKVVILGQDPYPTRGHAIGLAFSVPPGTDPLPGSLINVFKELAADLDRPVKSDGSLVPWTRHGVLLLNTILTVREGRRMSHSRIGWEALTGPILRVVASAHPEAVPILWGRPAQRFAAKYGFRDRESIASPHPSPLSASLGFEGSHPFTRCNEILRRNGSEPVDWSL